jgi:hypothetical protein
MSFCSLLPPFLRWSPSNFSHSLLHTQPPLGPNFFCRLFLVLWCRQIARARICPNCAFASFASCQEQPPTHTTALGPELPHRSVQAGIGRARRAPARLGKRDLDRGNSQSPHVRLLLPQTCPGGRGLHRCPVGLPFSASIILAIQSTFLSCPASILEPPVFLSVCQLLPSRLQGVIAICQVQNTHKNQAIRSPKNAFLFCRRAPTPRRLFSDLLTRE